MTSAFERSERQRLAFQSEGETPFKNEFDCFGDAAECLVEALNLVEEIARAEPRIEALEGALKWGQPSVTTRPKLGTPIRFGVLKSGEAALFVHCQTTLVSDWAASGLRFEGNRAVLLDGADPAALAGFIRAALLYRV